MSPKDSRKGIIDKIATMIFVIALVAWGGLFGYQKYVEASITSVEKEIIDIRKRVDSSRVDQFRALGRQVDASKRLLAEHISPTPLFEALEQYTVPSVQLGEFRFTVMPSGLEVEIAGAAENFAAVEQQEKVLLQAKDFRNPVVTEVSVAGEGGGAVFKATFIIPKEFVLYTELVRPIIEAQEALIQDAQVEQEDSAEIGEGLPSEDDLDALNEELDQI